MLPEIFSLFRQDSVIPFAILALVLVGWVVILERFITLQFIYRVNFKRFNQSMKKMLAAGDLERAKSLCHNTSKTGLPLITARAIEAYETDSFRVRLVLSEETLAFMPRIRRRISQLPNLATGAILLGSLAAIHGVWQAFFTAEILELGVKTFAFTQGISHSLTPLALAMFAAVILVLPYGILDAIAARLEGEIEHSLAIVLNILAPETQPVVAAIAAPAAQPVDTGFRDEPEQDEEPQGESIEDLTADIDNEVIGDNAEAVPDEEEII